MRQQLWSTITWMGKRWLCRKNNWPFCTFSKSWLVLNLGVGTIPGFTKEGVQVWESKSLWHKFKSQIVWIKYDKNNGPFWRSCFGNIILQNGNTKNVASKIFGSRNTGEKPDFFGTRPEPDFCYPTIPLPTSSVNSTKLYTYVSMYH